MMKAIVWRGIGDTRLDTVHEFSIEENMRVTPQATVIAPRVLLRFESSTAG